MVAFNKVNDGDVLYDCHRMRMGNTTMSRMGTWIVNVIKVDRDKRTALVSWNGNRPQTYCERDIERLRRSRPKERR